MKIEGVPEGWEIERVGPPRKGEYMIGGEGDPVQAIHDLITWKTIIRRIEKPKRYRPFASAAEFKPFRDKWWRYTSDTNSTARPPKAYSDNGWLTDSWDRLFERVEFEDGSPFGIEGTE